MQATVALKPRTLVRVFLKADTDDSRSVVLRVLSDSAETLVGVDVRTRIKHIIDKRAIERIEEQPR